MNEIATTIPQESPSLCTSVFLHENRPPSREEYTQVWIRLINLIVKNRNS